MTPKKILTIKYLLIIFLIFFANLIIMPLLLAQRLTLKVEVGNKISSPPETEEQNLVDFGQLPPNVESTRFINLKNESRVKRYIIVWKRGGIAEMMEVKKSRFTLSPGEEERIEFLIAIPPAAEEKNYDGKVTIFKLPKIL